MIFGASCVKLRHVTPGDVLRELRKEHGLRQEDVAARTGLDRSVVNQIERGKRGVGQKTADRLASLFDVDPQVFLTAESISRDRLRSLEAEVARLIESQREAQIAHDLLLERVEAMERRLRPGQLGARPVELATREGSVRRGLTP